MSLIPSGPKCVSAHNDRFQNKQTFAADKQIKKHYSFRARIFVQRMDPAVEAYSCTPGNYLNITDYERAIKMIRDRSENVITAIIVSLLMVISLLSNSTFIHTVRRVPSMQTVANAYLVNVAFADLIFVMTAGTFMLWTQFSSSVRHPARLDKMPSIGPGFSGCFISSFAVFLPYFTSINLITFVTIERYYAICRPLQHRQWTGKSRTKKTIATSWVLGSVLTLNVVPQYSGYEELCISWPEDDYFDFLPTRVGYCTSLPGVQVFPELFNVMIFFVALITNTIMYARIIIALHSRLSERSVGTRSTQSCTIRNQVARLLIVNGTLFFLL